MELNLGSMNAKCDQCGAFHFKGESVRSILMQIDPIVSKYKAKFCTDTNCINVRKCSQKTPEDYLGKILKFQEDVRKF